MASENRLIRVGIASLYALLNYIAEYVRVRLLKIRPNFARLVRINSIDLGLVVGT